MAARLSIEARVLESRDRDGYACRAFNCLCGRVNPADDLGRVRWSLHMAQVLQGASHLSHPAFKISVRGAGRSGVFGLEPPTDFGGQSSPFPRGVLRLANCVHRTHALSCTRFEPSAWQGKRGPVASSGSTLRNMGAVRTGQR